MCTEVKHFHINATRVNMMHTMSVLPDDNYDVIIIDASRRDDDDAMYLELTVTSGQRKGEVVTLRADNLNRDEIEMIGLPATLRVDGGVPIVDFD